MTLPRTSEPVEAQSSSERRLHARVARRTLESSVGKVIDLSPRGMRVQGPRRLRGTFDAVISDGSEPGVRVRARVVWSKRVGFRKHVTGLEFIDLPSSAAADLARIAAAE